MERIEWLENLVNKAKAYIFKLEKALSKCKEDRRKLLDDYWSMVDKIKTLTIENSRLKASLRREEISRQTTMETIDYILSVLADELVKVENQKAEEKLKERLDQLEVLKRTMENISEEDESVLENLKEELKSIEESEPVNLDNEIEGKELVENVDDSMEKFDRHERRERNVDGYA